MRRINLAKYKVQVVGPEGAKGDDYDVRGSLVALLLAPALQLNGAELRRNGKIADKVETCPGDTLALEETEYKPLEEAMEKCRGFGKNDRELVERVLGAEAFDPNATPDAGA